MGGKHVGCKPLPASCTGGLTFRDSMAVMENLENLYLEAGLTYFLDHTLAFHWVLW